MKTILIKWRNNNIDMYRHIAVPTEASEGSLTFDEKIILFLSGYDENGNRLK
jgi:hypothetical protein